MNKDEQGIYVPELFDTNPSQITNVASVPQLSPFRYPGGKTWLVPRIRSWLKSKTFLPAKFIEPFAGGGIIGLTVASEGLANHIEMIEIDELVAAVWNTIIEDTGGGEWLMERIASFDFGSDSVQTVLNTNPATTRELAFQAIIKNRVSHGGIMAHGAGILKAGEDGKGLSSRWYPETLQKRIREIVNIRDRITFVNGDGINRIRQYSDYHDVIFFIDPPYTASKKRAGRRLYNHFDVNHSELFRLWASDLKVSVI